MEAVAGLREFITTDPVASYRFELPKSATRKRAVSYKLTDALTPGGEWPELLTMRQAEVLMMGRAIKPTSIVKVKGVEKVRCEYIIDEIAEHFKMSEEEFRQSVIKIRDMELTST